jgi:hypothetical protein
VCFHATPVPGPARPRPDHVETSDAMWVDLGVLAGLPMHPVMRHWIDDALASAPERLFAQP